jgi:hypothetical protein
MVPIVATASLSLKVQRGEMLPPHLLLTRNWQADPSIRAVAVTASQISSAVTRPLRTLPLCGIVCFNVRCPPSVLSKLIPLSEQLQTAVDPLTSACLATWLQQCSAGA